MAGRRDRQTQLAREASSARASRQRGEDAPETPGEVSAAPAPARTGSGSTAAAAPAAEERTARTKSKHGAGESPAKEPAREKVGGKGRPTPKRKEAEAANRRPVVIADRKAAKKEARARRQEAYQRQQEGIARGDERYFMPRDRGPARAYARDLVDARWNFGELMVPVALVALVAMMFGNVIPDVVAIIAVVTYVVLLAALLDAVFVAQTTKRRAIAKFNKENVPAWTGWYAAMRALMIRRLRSPKPRVARGQKIA